MSDAAGGAAAAAASASAASSSGAPVEDATAGQPVEDTFDDGSDDADIAELRAKVAAMEEEQMEEAKRMGELSGTAPSNPVGSGSSAASKAALTADQQADVDSRSVHVAQVDYSVTEDELKKLFEACGPVNRVTILKDRYSGQPKGFAYVEFAAADAISNAMILNDTEFKGRTLKITAKRTNIPGFNRGGGRGGGRGRGRGGPRGGFAGGYDESGGYGPVRGRGRGRGRGAPRGGYHPYQYQY